MTLAFVAIALAAAWLALDDTSIRQQPSVGASDPSIHAPSNEGAHSLSLAVAPATAPPLSTPLPDLWPALAPAARAGHAPSACRLAIETLRCAAQVSARSLSSRPPTNLPSGELDALQAFVNDPSSALGAISAPAYAAPGMMARIERMNAEIDRFCGPTVPEHRSEAFALLRQSALAGVPDAQTVYVAWDVGLMPGTMAEPTFERWMEEAPTVLTRMLDAGHPDAPRLLSEAYARDRFHGWLFPYDLTRSVAYGQLDRRLGNRGRLASQIIELRRSALTGTQRLEADRLTEQMFGEHYARRPTLARENERQLMGTIYTGIGPLPPGREHECKLAKEGESR